MTYFKDIFTEDKNDNKYSSKKTMGLISGILVCLAFIGDGFHFFTVNENLFNTMLIYSGTMLGVSTAKAIFKKTPPKDEN
jgi:purine-cytosine permease-like protein